MEFTFDLSQTPVIGRRQRPSSGGSHYQPQHYSTASSAMSASDYGSFSVASTATIVRVSDFTLKIIFLTDLEFNNLAR
jgi:hypothetical protein